MQRVPALMFDDGTVLTESIAICRYFEELQPEPALFGRSALEKARIEMWNRRMEMNLFHMVQHVFRHTHPAMKDMEAQVPRLLGQKGPQGQAIVLPAYDHVLKASHLFNLMDARGAIAVAERQSYIARIRDLTKLCAQAWVANEGGNA